MKNKKDYVYSSTELSRYYGISVKGMEFYEQKQLVHPERIGPGKTRRYDLLDCYRLAAVRMLRNCGFTIEETATLLSHADAEHVQRELELRAEKIEEEIRQQQAVQRGMARICEGIRRIEAGDTAPRITEHGAFVRLFIRGFHAPHESSTLESDQLSEWNGLMPMTEASLRFDKDALEQGADDLRTEVGMIISEEDFERFGLSLTARNTRIAPGRAVWGIVEGPETELHSPERLRGLMAFIHEQGLRIAGDAFTRLIFVLEREEGVRVRCDEVWIPVEN